jgi:uncharacterized membrane protein YhaH (DUF805 family)
MTVVNALKDFFSNILVSNKPITVSYFLFTMFSLVIFILLGLFIFFVLNLLIGILIKLEIFIILIPVLYILKELILLIIPIIFFVYNFFKYFKSIQNKENQLLLILLSLIFYIFLFYNFIYDINNGIIIYISTTLFLLNLFFFTIAFINLVNRRLYDINKGGFLQLIIIIPIFIIFTSFYLETLGYVLQQNIIFTITVIISLFIFIFGFIYLIILLLKPNKENKKGFKAIFKNMFTGLRYNIINFFDKLIITKGVVGRSKFWWTTMLYYLYTILFFSGYMNNIIMKAIFMFTSCFIVYYSFMAIYKTSGKDEYNYKSFWLFYIFVSIAFDLLNQYYNFSSSLLDGYSLSLQDYTNNKYTDFIYRLVISSGWVFVSIGYITLRTRRLHDIGRSGLLQLWFYIPSWILGVFIIIKNITTENSIKFTQLSQADFLEHTVFFSILCILLIIFLIGYIYIFFQLIKASKITNNSYLDC